jgi:hypothetical protein
MENIFETVISAESNYLVLYERCQMFRQKPRQQQTKNPQALVNNV